MRESTQSRSGPGVDESRSQEATIVGATGEGSSLHDARDVPNLGDLPFPFDTSEILLKMIHRFRETGRAQSVSFRRLVPWLKKGERATHYLHSYPAKLLPQIAHFFLASNILTVHGDVVLDPFGGSGTVALETILAGRNAIYSDVNPLARLITKVKTTPLKQEVLRQHFVKVNRYYLRGDQLPGILPSTINVPLWYRMDTAIALSRLKQSIGVIEDADVRDFFLVVFSSTCRKTSLADPRLSVPVRRRDLGENLSGWNPPAVWQTFSEQFESGLQRMLNFTEMKERVHGQTSAVSAGTDARALISPYGTGERMFQPLASRSVNMIITSPPYAGAQKYIRSSSLSLGWLDLLQDETFAQLHTASIGREHFRKASSAVCPSTGVLSADLLIQKIFKTNPTRGAIVSNYLVEMESALSEMYRVLKVGGSLVLIIGDNEVCKLPFKSSDYLTEICGRIGLKLELKLVDCIHSRGLMTRRNKTAGLISREWVLLFRKESHQGRGNACREANISQET